MPSLRALLSRRPTLGLAVLAVAMALRLAVPTGFMPAVDQGRIVFTICGGAAPVRAAVAMAAPMPGKMHHKPAKTGDHGKPEQPCTFTGLSAPVLPATAAILPAVAVVLVVAPHLPPLARPAPRPAQFLRPPLRGPPPRR